MTTEHIYVKRDFYGFHNILYDVIMKSDENDKVQKVYAYRYMYKDETQKVEKSVCPSDDLTIFRILKAIATGDMQYDVLSKKEFDEEMKKLD